MFFKNKQIENYFNKKINFVLNNYTSDSFNKNKRPIIYFLNKSSNIKLFKNTQIFLINNKFNQRYNLSLIKNNKVLTLHSTYTSVMDIDKKKNKNSIYMNKMNYFIEKFFNQNVSNFTKILLINNMNGFFLKNINFFLKFVSFYKKKTNFFLIITKEFLDISNKKFKKIRTVQKQKRKLIAKLDRVQK